MIHSFRFGDSYRISEFCDKNTIQLLEYAILPLHFQKRKCCTSQKREARPTSLLVVVENRHNHHHDISNQLVEIFARPNASVTMLAPNHIYITCSLVEICLSLQFFFCVVDRLPCWCYLLLLGGTPHGDIRPLRHLVYKSSRPFTSS